MRFERARELNRLAGVLADENGGLPRWVAHNRAVSTSYYALFHALAEFCALNLIGAWRPYPAFRHVYRSLDHGTAKTVLSSADPDMPPSESLRRLGAFFDEFQDKRHRADYDPSYRISHADLRALIADTNHQITALDELAPEEGRLLAARLIGRTRNQPQRPRTRA